MGTPYKMKGSPMARNFGAPFRNDKKKMQDGNTSITDASQNQANIAELKKAKKNTLSPSDLQASKDTIHQSNIQYMEKNWGDKGPIGVVKRNNIEGSKKAQTNKKIKTSGKALSNASKRSSERISTSNSAQERTRGNADKLIKVNQDKVNQRANLEIGLKKFSPPKPTAKPTTIGRKSTKNSNKKIKVSYSNSGRKA
tara:strand:+ start:7 stop:597 length:591 start_codon:yes stop_codon:yes gene_type:complete